MSRAPTSNLYPIVGVSIGVWHKGRVLVIKRGKEPLLGKWSFPGGQLEFGEKLADAALREVREETNVTAEIAGFVTFVELFARDKTAKALRHVVLNLFAARFVTGDIKAGSDASEARFVDVTELSKLDTTPGLEGYALQTRGFLDAINKRDEVERLEI